MNNLEYYHLISKYTLIGIGEFSHGIDESWQFRMNLLKYCIKYTNKKIVIFNEQSVWQAQNIMNKTYYDVKNNKFVKSNKIKFEKEFQKSKELPAWGKLWQYMFHSMESKIGLQIIKFIRKNKKRIKLVGVDNDRLARDLDMSRYILKKLDKNNINFFWAHNAHIDNRKLSKDNYKWIKDKYPEQKWYSGHYLKQKLGDKYCIILSQAYKGENRFNGYCSGEACKNRMWTMKYIYKKFVYKPNKKYVDNSKKCQLLTDFNNRLIEFSNSYYKENKNGYQSMVKTDGWNYILFWNEVTRLKPYYEY